jgi:hypothetical protein
MNIPTIEELTKIGHEAEEYAALRKLNDLIA